MAKKRGTPPEGDYEVGYGRPPKQHQFKKGISGNPSGRRKGVRNSKTVLSDILFEPVKVMKNGEPVEIPMIEAILCRLATEGAKGELKAAMYISEKFFQQFPGEEEAEADLSEEDAAILARHDSQLLKNSGAKQAEGVAKVDDTNLSADHDGEAAPETDGGGDGSL